ncbi:hypothetical protein IH992_01730 [Candidatus Poribacteria bacterium]|nr:hypothetical protein [Candidatus Poribacteria bacterium]
MKDITFNATKLEDKDKMPPLGPMTKEETEAYYKIFDQLIGLLADCTEEELAAFDSTLRHPPTPVKSEHQP